MVKVQNNMPNHDLKHENIFYINKTLHEYSQGKPDKRTFKKVLLI